jgi:transketolase
MRDVFVQRLQAIATTDARVTLITGDLGFGVLDKFAAALPGQYLNAGVAEQNMTGLATGLALEGRVVFTYSIANFPTLRCLEQIRNDACYHGADVKVVAIGGGFSYGALGISHHATEDLAILRALPDITVVVPGCDWEAEEATAALVAKPGTAYLRLDKSTAGNTRREGERFELGRWRTVREGSALTVITSGGILGVVLKAAETLAGEGVDVRVVSAHTLKPFDRAAIGAACSETGGILTVEEHTLDGGLGSVVAESCLDEGWRPKAFGRLGLVAGFSSLVGSQDYLRSSYGLDERAVVGAVRDLLAGRRVRAGVRAE